MLKFRLVMAAALTLLIMIVLLQNSEPVETRIFFWSFTLARWVLLLLTSVIGFALGVLGGFILWGQER